MIKCMETKRKEKGEEENEKRENIPIIIAWENPVQILALRPK